MVDRVDPEMVGFARSGPLMQRWVHIEGGFVDVRDASDTLWSRAVLVSPAGSPWFWVWGSNSSDSDFAALLKDWQIDWCRHNENLVTRAFYFEPPSIDAEGRVPAEWQIGSEALQSQLMAFLNREDRLPTTVRTSSTLAGVCNYAELASEVGEPASLEQTISNLAFKGWSLAIVPATSVLKIESWASTTELSDVDKIVHEVCLALHATFSSLTDTAAKREFRRRRRMLSRRDLTINQVFNVLVGTGHCLALSPMGSRLTIDSPDTNPWVEVQRLLPG